MRAKTKKVRRIVLGVGHPWFSVGMKRRIAYDTVRLFTAHGSAETVPFKFTDVGNWNKCRLVLEVIK